MCRNHSHAKVVPTGFLTVGPTALVEYRTVGPLVLELPYGEKYTRAPMTALWLPVSMSVPLPPSIPVAMAVCFTSLSYMEDGAMTATPEMEMKRITTLPSGAAALKTMASSRTNTAGGYDDVLPF